MQVDRVSRELQESGCAVLAVGFATIEEFKRWEPVSPVRIPVFVDPERRVYAAVGAGKTRLQDLLKPRVILHYLRLLRKWGKPRKPEQDPWQLGGDYLVDSTGRVLWAYPSKNPADRPAVDVLRDVVRRYVGGRPGAARS